MAETLEKQGLETPLLDLRHTKQKQWPLLASFDGLLVGSGIRIRWVREATTFPKKHAEELKALKAKGLVVGVFVSCGTASIPGKLEEARQNYIEKGLAEVGITDAVDTYDASGGVFDLSPSAPLGFLDKKMLAAVTKARR
jgi:menaquinone-dependent protoporphyrinogen IX oxidase